MEFIKNLFEQNDDYQALTRKQILSTLNHLYITSISLKDEEIINYNEKIIKKIYTTIDQPFLVGEDIFSLGNTLYINPDYYLQNKEEVESLLSEILEKTEEKQISIESTALITKNVIASLSKSTSIEEITLAKYDENKYTLTEEDYHILKNSKIKTVKTSAVAESLKDNFDPLISYNATRPLIGNNLYQDLQNEKIYLHHKINNLELENLKYLMNSTTKIIIEEKYLEDALLITKKLEELGKENHVIVNVQNKELITSQILSNRQYLNKNIDIQLGVDYLPLEEYLRLEKILYKMVEPTKDLSPFEKYIYIYNIVKQFKQYKENKEDKSASRNLYAILENEFMVCAGYSNLLGDLLNKCGIKSIKISVGVDTSYDMEDENKVISTNCASHARRYIYINDPKYNIDGFYIADPTWDNHLKKDLYNHLVLTGEEETNTSRYNYLLTSVYNSFEELTNINSLENLYQKINFYLDKNPNNKLKDIISILISSLKELVPTFIKSLEEKYPEIKKNYAPWPSEKDILYDIGEFLLTKVNKSVSGQTIMSAVSEVYQKSYRLEGKELQDKLQKTLEINQQYQHILFPKREKIDEYGNKIELPGISDKFNIDTNNYHK